MFHVKYNNGAESRGFEFYEEAFDLLKESEESGVIEEYAKPTMMQFRILKYVSTGFIEIYRGGWECLKQIQFLSQEPEDEYWLENNLAEKIRIVYNPNL